MAKVEKVNISVAYIESIINLAILK